MGKMTRREALLFALGEQQDSARAQRTVERMHHASGRSGLGHRHGLRAQQHERAAVLLQEILDELKGADDANR